MPFFIFRKSDRVHLYTARDAGSLVTERAAALTNEKVTDDELVVVLVQDEVPKGMIPELQLDGTVIYIDNPKIAAKNIIRTSLTGKLIALGLTADEVRILGVT